MNIFLIFSFIAIFSINVQARTAIGDLKEYNINTIKNKNDKTQLINTINGIAKGLNYDRNMNKYEFKTSINAAQQTVMVNGPFYDWFDEELMPRLNGNNPSFPTLGNESFLDLHQADSDKADKFLKHQVYYYVANRYLQHKHFSSLYSVTNKEYLLKNITDKLKSNKITKRYFNGKTEKDIENFGERVLQVAREQKHPIDFSNIEVKDKTYKLISLNGFREKEYSSFKTGITKTKDKKVGYTGAIARTVFSKDNKLIGVDYFGKNNYLPIGDQANTNYIEGEYSIDDTMAEINETWGDVASLFTIENGGSPMLHLFWISALNPSQSKPVPDHTKGVLYGYIDSDLLPEGIKGTANIRRLIKLSKTPTGMSDNEKKIINKRVEALNDQVNHWKSKTYPVQVINKYLKQFDEFDRQAQNAPEAKRFKQYPVNKFNSKSVEYIINNRHIKWHDKKGEIQKKALQNIIELNKVWDIFDTISNYEYSKAQAMLIPTQDDLAITGYPYSKIDKSKSVKLDKPINIKVNTLQFGYRGRPGFENHPKGLNIKILSKKDLSIPYLANTLLGNYFQKLYNNKNFDLAFYEIEDTLKFYQTYDGHVHLDNKDIGAMYKQLFKLLFTPKIIYMTVKKPNENKITIHQATPGIPTPRMLRKLQVLQITLRDSYGQGNVLVKLYNGISFDELVALYNRKTEELKGTAYGNLVKLKEIFETN